MIPSHELKIKVINSPSPLQPSLYTKVNASRAVLHTRSLTLRVKLHPNARSRDSEEREAVRTACAAVDSALRANIEGNISSGKVFRELKGVDAAVSSACSGVIRVLLSQVK